MIIASFLTLEVPDITTSPYSEKHWIWCPFSTPTATPWKSVFLHSLYTVKSLVFPQIVCKFKFLTSSYIPRIPNIQKTRYPSVRCNVITQPDAMLYACMFLQCLCTSCSSSAEWAHLLSSPVSLLLLSLITHSSESFRLSKPFSLFKSFLSNV